MYNAASATPPVIQIRSFAITVPAGTAKANPQVTALPVEDSFVIVWAELEVPPGNQGNLGFYLASSGTPMLPFAAPLSPQWFVMESVMPRYEMDPSIHPGAWSCVAYNTGVKPHTFYVRFGLALAPDPAGPALRLPLLGSGNLSGVAGGA